MTARPRGALLAAGILLVAELGWPQAASAACQIVTGGNGMQLTVVLVSSPGSTLTVDWGDGVTTTDQEERPGRVRVSHDYAAAGDYQVAVTEAGADGTGCSVQVGLGVPLEQRGGEPEGEALLRGEDPPVRPIPTSVEGARGGRGSSFGSFLRDLLDAALGRR